MESHQWEDNPADCASRGLFPSELISHEIWWAGPHWLQRDISEWPKLSVITCIVSEEMRDITLASNVHFSEPAIPLSHYSDFHHLKRVTAWILIFVNNCRLSRHDTCQR